MADTATQSPLSETVNRMLFLDSVEAIQASAQSVPRIQHAELLTAFDGAAGRLGPDDTAERELLSYVRHIVEDLIVRDPSYPLLARLGPVVLRAVAAPTMFAAYEVLREHRSVLTVEQFDLLQAMVVAAYRKNIPIDAKGGFRSALALGVVLRDERRLCNVLLMWGGDCRGQGRPEAALRRFARAAEIARGVGDDRLLLHAESGWAGVAEDLGDREGAVARLRPCLARADRAGLDEVASGIRSKLISLLLGLGRYSEALVFLDHAVAVTDTPDKPELRERAATVHLRRGRTLEDVGRHDDGEIDFLRARELAAEVGARTIEFAALSAWASSPIKRGDVAIGVRRWEGVRGEVERWGIPDTIASARDSLGNAYMSAGRPNDAMREFGLALQTKLASGDRGGALTLHLAMGDAADRMGNAGAASGFWMLALLESMASSRHDVVAQLASRLTQLDDVNDGAVAMLENVHATLINRGPLTLDLTMTSALGQLAIKRGDEERALNLYRGAAERAARSELRSPGGLGIEIRLGQLEARRGDTRRAGYERLRRALADVESQLAAVTLDERRSEIAGRFIDVYDGLLEATLTHGREVGAEHPEREAFRLHEEAKARSFIAGLAEADVTVPNSVPSDLQASERRLLAIERGLQDREGRSDYESTAYRRQRLREVHDELEACWTAMAAHAPEYVRLRRGDPVDVDELRGFLVGAGNEPMAVVSFFCGAETTTMFVVRSDTAGVQTFTSPTGRARIEQAALELRRAFNGDPRSFPPYPPIRREKPERRKLPVFEAVSAELLRFLPAVEDIELLCVAPHGPLHLLPIHAMPLDTGGVVADRHALAYTPSATALVYALQNRHDESTGNPHVYVAGTASLADARPELFEEDVELFDPHAWEVTSDPGAAATPHRARDQLGRNDVAHITCHGHFDSERPLRSGLLLADGRSRPPRDLQQVSLLERRDYLLTAEELLRTAIRTDLLMLRACSTGLQRERNAGDELDGLVRSLIYAGCRSVIVTLWNVDQESSLEFARTFYTHWGGSPREPKWRALWSAQRELRGSAAAHYLSHPYHWAPFVLVGDWR